MDISVFFGFGFQFDNLKIDKTFPRHSIIENSFFLKYLKNIQREQAKKLEKLDLKIWNVNSKSLQVNLTWNFSIKLLKLIR